jgi:hypothetical protein
VTAPLSTPGRCDQCETYTRWLSGYPPHGLLCPVCVARQIERDEPGHGLASSTFGFLSDTE